MTWRWCLACCTFCLSYVQMSHGGFFFSYFVCFGVEVMVVRFFKCKIRFYELCLRLSKRGILHFRKSPFPRPCAKTKPLSFELLVIVLVVAFSRNCELCASAKTIFFFYRFFSLRSGPLAQGSCSLIVLCLLFLIMKWFAVKCSKTRRPYISYKIETGIGFFRT